MGGTLNTNFDIIDRVLSGVGSVALSGTTHTLTTSDGALSDGQFKVINFTGALGANNTITISPNDQDKLYFIINSTTDSGSSGPYSIIISQGSGANVTIPNGGFDIVIADGAVVEPQLQVCYLKNNHRSTHYNWQRAYS